MPARGGRLCAALVGAGIGRSLSPAMHEAEARAQGLALRYGLIDTDDAQALASAIERVRAGRLIGLNVTHPFKQRVIAHLDRLSEGARRLGAVNTVVLRRHETVGHNTDHCGFCASFRRGLAGAARARVLVLGAGGAGAAVAFGLLECGAGEVLICDTDAGDAAAPASVPDPVSAPAPAPHAGRARALAARVRRHHPGARVRAMTRLSPEIVSGVDGIVNATPVGMESHPGSAVPLDWIAQRHWVMDIVYFPLETALLSQARALGCRTLSGAGMAVGQAVAAFALFTGRRADGRRMAATFRRLAAARPS